MSNILTRRLIESVPGLDAAASKLHALFEPILGQEAPRPLRDALYGTWLRHPLHPSVVDVPIGAWTCSMVLDLTGHEEAADLMLKLGTVSAGAAALTGVAQWQDLQEMEEPRRLGTLHALLNGVASGCYVGSWVCRDRGARPAGIALSTTGYAIASFSAWLGGDLAYDLGVGVNRLAFDEPEKDWVEVASESDLDDGKPLRVEAAGIPVMLVRQDGEILAITATCPHVGGPLDEGEIKDGTVTCPWHGSVMDLRTAAVCHGPATSDGLAYQVRVQDGSISVRPKRVEAM